MSLVLEALNNCLLWIDLKKKKTKKTMQVVDYVENAIRFLCVGRLGFFVWINFR